MTCATICRDDEVALAQEGVGFIQIGQVAVGEDDDAFWEQKSSDGGGWL